MNTYKDLTIEEAFNLAVKNYQEGKTDIAQELYNKVLKINPNHPQAHNNLGNIFNKLCENQKAKCINAPYKYNRAVLFNSTYFHETDEIDFKDEYVGRRINNTYLFGTRLVK